MIRTSRVIIDVTWDDEESSSPEYWDWDELIGAPEGVVVIEVD